MGDDYATNGIGVGETAIEREGNKVSVKDGGVKVEVDGDVKPGGEEREETRKGGESREVA